jgi:hypothetical protein
MTDKEKHAMASMVYEAVRFALWAAGQGICPAPGEDAVAPEDFLFEYAKAVDVDDWDGLHLVARDAVLSALPPAHRANSTTD